MTVVAVGAHPDDVDLYAGGLVAALARAGERVALVDLSAGEMATRGTPELRAREAAEAARHLGAASRECLRLPDGGIARTDAAQTRSVVEVLRRHRPSLILAPWEEDLHPDHRETAHLVRRARFFARLAGYAAAGEPCRPGPVLFYEQKLPFVPDLIVDIGVVREAKLAAVRAFASQFFREPDDPVRTEISDPGFHEMLEARSRERGARIGVTWGEGYRRDGPQAVVDPRQLIPGAPA
ncbi:MAG: bacillithiol biosynthesis deacetylase BshB1 [Candidatus Eiseniibacteriota bacterium]